MRCAICVCILGILAVAFIQGTASLQAIRRKVRKVASTQPTQCMSDCTDQADGDYQSCNGCDVYATCSNGILTDNKPCGENQFWDDNEKMCVDNSATCPE